MAEKDNKTSTNKYAEQRRTQYEIDTVVIDGKTFTVINAFPTDTDVTVEDRLRYLVKVVRKIYELCADGKGTRAICRYLEEHEIESPGVYEFHTRGTKSKHPDLEHPYLWTQSTVRDMLSNRVYCGDTVNFQTYSKSNKLKKRIKNDPENILIFENTHEAIISRELFALVQKHYEGRKRPDIQCNTDKYAGYLYCADCGMKLYLHRGKHIKPDHNFYECGGYQTKGGGYCSIHHIKAMELDEVVLAELKKITLLAREHPQQFYEMAMKNGEKEAQKLRKESVQKKSKLEKRNRELDNIIRCLYEDRVTGRITPERYDSLAAGYEKEQSELKTELAELSDQLDTVSLQEKYVLDFIEKAKANIELKEVTPELLRAFISRIEVYEKPEKYSRTCGNMILIHYTFLSINKPAPMFTPTENKTFAQATC